MTTAALPPPRERPAVVAPAAPPGGPTPPPWLREQGVGREDPSPLGYVHNTQAISLEPPGGGGLGAPGVTGAQAVS